MLKEVKKGESVGTLAHWTTSVTPQKLYKLLGEVYFLAVILREKGD